MQTGSILTVFENRLMPLAERLAGYSVLHSVRSALIATMPLVFLGSLAELLNSFPLDAYKLFMLEHFGPNWTMFGQSIKNSTFAVISLITLFSVGQYQAERFNAEHPLLRVNPVIAGLVCFVCYLCLLQTDVVDGLFSERRWLGVSGLFIAIIVGVLASQTFLALYKVKRLHFRMPGGTPDMSITQTFMALFPAMLTILLAAALGTVLQAFTGDTVPELAHELIRVPFEAFQGLTRGILYILSVHVLWFMGIHGSNVLDPITHHIYGAAIAANEMASMAGEPLPHVMTKTFLDTFVFMGGSGTSICLALALLLFGRTQSNRKLGGVSLIPGLFNINEVLLFGLPIILNPIMFIPFVGTPLILSIVSYLAVSSGLVPGTSAVVEWTTPIVLNGYMSTGSVLGPVLQIGNLILGTLVYAPFVVLTNRLNEKRMQAAFARLFDRSCATTETFTKCIDHHDDAGSLARSLLTDLQYDLDAGKGLCLEYQPQISASTGRVVGVEALFRWRHETYGTIPAPITIALAEDSGLIVPLGDWVFTEACRTRLAWLHQGINDVRMAVNVSGLQLKKSLPDRLTTVLGYFDLEPSMMEIEVTESSALDSDMPESAIIATLHDRGFPIAIDDFGMGHSSLKYLKSFPVNVIKIDGALSRDVLTNPICVDIVASITRLCRARGMTSVAEFVETEEQATVLITLGCDVLQGYLYSRPLDAAACLEFIRSNRLAVPPVGHDPRDVFVSSPDL